ncbi:phosphoribosylglycinamide formyltransferase [Cellulophaga geojensis KL-A]|uniref:Phosphoribosylglycinamide formyltransferase n=1 Tax=Cellulophaga geojensis KL-A TaxID=1328323 RepID=A0ABN0RN26_9FLAO|nr:MULTISPECIES: phosphoribosylglycinamide formyltransferase [Cellulophaga]AIM60121.1 phosphoribosylglycinamide formyltransferase [Cellulophaga lytica]EWH13215.1 phosphoribosylglycinamide formyltransferase [Cellulophaga geojensis KL-A]
MKRIVLLASGSGSNVENIANYFKDNPLVTITCVLTNKRDAKVIDRCNRLNISSLYFNREAFSKSDCLLDIIKGMQPDLIILAGFLLKIPQKFVDAFPNKIVNIHPALLPNYGGKGMYGMHVHNAVKNNNESKTGITIHYVNENYDEGAIIYQAETAVNSNDSVDDIAKKVHMLEYEHFPKVIDQLLSK